MNPPPPGLAPAPGKAPPRSTFGAPPARRPPGIAAGTATKRVRCTAGAEAARRPASITRQSARANAVRRTRASRAIGQARTTHDVGTDAIGEAVPQAIRSEALPSPVGQTTSAAAEVAGQATGSGAIAGAKPSRAPWQIASRSLAGCRLPGHSALPARRPSRAPVGQIRRRASQRPNRGLPGHRAIPRRGPFGERPARRPSRTSPRDPAPRGPFVVPLPRRPSERPRPAFKPCLADENAGRAEVRWTAARRPALNAGLQFRPPWARPDARRVFVALRKGLANAEDEGGGITPPRRRSARIEVRSFRSERKLSTLSFRIERRSLRRLATFTNRSLDQLLFRLFAQFRSPDQWRRPPPPG